MNFTITQLGMKIHQVYLVMYSGWQIIFSGTTIYTIFRSFVSDFGVAGSFLIYFLFGYLSSFLQ